MSPSQHPETNTREVFSLRESAAWLGIGVSTMRELVYGRKIRSARVGRRVLIRKEWLQRYLDDSARLHS